MKGKSCRFIRSGGLIVWEGAWENLTQEKMHCKKNTFHSVTNVSNIMQGWSDFTDNIKQNMMTCIMAAILARMLGMSFIVG